MKNRLPEAPKAQWTLIRRARQLLTLQGPTGPRRGAALNELGIISDGALLIRNGVIEEVGTSRRLESLAAARAARSIDASGKIVMPAFVDPDAVLVYPPPAGPRSPEDASDTRLRVVSKRLLGIVGASHAAEWVRAGVLTVGSHTGFAFDLRDTIRVLRIHQTLQSKPLRIRSIFSPRPGDTGSILTLLGNLEDRWLEVIRKRKLAAITEFCAQEEVTVAQLRRAATVATAIGFAVRIRSEGELGADLLNLAVAAGSVALIAPPTEPVDALREMAMMGGVHILPVGSAVAGHSWNAGAVRREIDAGVSLAIASAFNPAHTCSMNPQYLLYLAVDRCSMTVQEAIVAATYNAACSLRMSNVTGSLEPGKAADLLIIDVPDYRDLIRRVGHSDVELVMRAGHVVCRRAGLTDD